MIILGAVLLILGFLLGIQILWIVGVVLLVVGAVLTLAGTAGHAIGGRKTWY